MNVGSLSGKCHPFSLAISKIRVIYVSYEVVHSNRLMITPKPVCDPAKYYANSSAAIPKNRSHYKHE